MKREVVFSEKSLEVTLLPPQETPLLGIVVPKLVHGAEILTITSLEQQGAQVDALITNARSLSLGIKTADCASVCFGDGTTIGIAHVGWRGLCLGLTEKMLPHFDAASLSVYVAPFLHVFEIQRDECYKRIEQKFGKQFFEEYENAILFHFVDAIASLLPRSTKFDARSTIKDDSFPSYRRNKTAERFFTVVRFPV